jgi:hypothetical protein
MKPILIGLSALMLLASACGGNSNNPPADAGIDAGIDAGVDAGAADCVTNPTTSTDILNACTDAGFIDKTPVLPKLQADGGLPPLQ